MAPTTEEIINIIQNYDGMIKVLNKRIKDIEYEYQNLEQNLYKYTSYKSTTYGSTGNKGFNHDLSDILKTIDQRGQEYSLELKDTLSDLIFQIDKIRRVHLCYMVLPYEQHELLRILYEKNVTWGRASIELDVSISTLSRKRTKAIFMIKTACGSDLSNIEILGLQKLKKGITWDKLMQKEKICKKQ